MIVGRRTESYTLPERNQQISSTVNTSGTARNLRKNDLGGVIFGCTHHTMKECLSNQIFGLPGIHFTYIKNIKPGLPLFLFNYSDRKLHGIFEAASHGEMNINPYGWSADGSERTQYPAQVRIHSRMQCQPLAENKYKQVICDNYYKEDHFWFELDHAQTGGLISLFESSPMSGSVISRSAKTTPKWQSPLKPLIKHEKKLEKQYSWASVSDDDFALPEKINVGTWSQTLFPQTSSKWDVLSNNNLDTDASNEDEDEDEGGDEDSRPSSSEVDVSCFDKTNKESGTLCTTPCMDEDKVEVEDEEELIYRKLKQLILDREHSKSHPIDDEELVDPCQANVTPLENDCAPEAPLEYEDKVEVEDEENVVPYEANITPLEYDCAPEEPLEYEDRVEVENEVNVVPCEANVTPLEYDCAPEAPLLGNEENGVPCEESVTPLEYDCAQEAPYSGDEENVVQCEANITPSPEAPLFSAETAEKYEEVPVNSPYFEHLINQLRQEVDQLKASSSERIQKILLLERKLTEREIEVQQLTMRVEELESQLVPSSTSFDGTSNQSSVSCETLEESFDEPPLCANGLVYIIGGYDSNSWLSALDCYSPSTDRMKSLKPMSSFRSYAAAAALNGDIYIFGGGDGGMWYDTVESYNPLRNEWTPRPSLIQKKGSLAGATLHDKIFAIGGGDGVECFSDVEMFDPAVGRWIRTQSMLEKRFSFAAAEHNGVIYAAGGFDGHNYLKSAERFDPREVVSWSRLPNMNTSRACHSLVVLNEKVYALGGYDGTKMIPSIEVFDPRMDSWIAGDEMKESRGYSIAAVIGESIFVITGLKDGRIMTNTVEFYKEGHGWSVLNVKGVGKRCFCSSIVL